MKEKTKDYNEPEVVEELGQIGNDKHLLKVRVIRYQHPMIGKSEPFIDIRRYYTNKKNTDGSLYTGFGAGVSIRPTDFVELVNMVPKKYTNPPDKK